MAIHVTSLSPEETREAILELTKAQKPFSVTLRSKLGEPADHGNSFEQMPNIGQTHLVGENTRGDVVRLAFEDVRDVDEKMPRVIGDPFEQAIPTGAESNAFC